MFKLVLRLIKLLETALAQMLQLFAWAQRLLKRINEGLLPSFASVALTLGPTP